MPDLNDDARRILAALAAADGSVNWWDLLLRLAPEPKRRWGFVRKAEYNAWLDRRNALIMQEVRLFVDGLVDRLPDPKTDMAFITAAGQEALAAVAEESP